MKKLEQIYEGKAKKVFRTDDPERFIVEYKDDATAFNGQKKGTILGKGSINNRMTNNLMRRLEEKGVRLVLVTLGEEGAFCRWKGESLLVPGVKTAVADTNGAGDTFLGAVLARLCARGERPLEGLEQEQLRDILAFANRAAALTCSRSGAIPAMPVQEEVERYAQAGYLEE